MEIDVKEPITRHVKQDGDNLTVSFTNRGGAITETGHTVMETSHIVMETNTNLNEARNDDVTIKTVKESKKLCRYYESGSCKLGMKCKYVHVQTTAGALIENGTEHVDQCLSSALTDGSKDESSNTRSMIRNKQVCRFYKQDGFCKYKNKCKFSHGMVNNEHNDNVFQDNNTETSAWRCNDDPGNTSATVNYEGHSECEVTKAKCEVTEARCEVTKAKCDVTDEEYNSETVSGSRNKFCKYFGSQRGCRFGDQCSFLHYRSVSDAAEEVQQHLPNSPPHDVTEELQQHLPNSPVHDMTEKLQQHLSNSSPHDVTEELQQQLPKVVIKECYLDEDVKNVCVDKESQIQEYNLDKKEEYVPICRWFLRKKGCIKGDHCAFKHVGKNLADSSVEKDDSSVKKDSAAITNIESRPHESNKHYRQTEGRGDADQNKSLRKCRFYFSNKGCRLMDKCPYSHDDGKFLTQPVNKTRTGKNKSIDEEVVIIENDKEKNSHEIIRINAKEEKYENKVNKEHNDVVQSRHDKNILNDGKKMDRVDVNKQNKKEDVNKDNINKKENSKQTCKFYSSEKGCFKGFQCSFAHVDGSKDDDYYKLCNTEFRQLEKRFSAGNNFVLVQKEPTTIYLVNVTPTDPDWVSKTLLFFIFRQLSTYVHRRLL